MPLVTGVSPTKNAPPPAHSNPDVLQQMPNNMHHDTIHLILMILPPPPDSRFQLFLFLVPHSLSPPITKHVPAGVLILVLIAYLYLYLYLDLDMDMILPTADCCLLVPTATADDAPPDS